MNKQNMKVTTADLRAGAAVELPLRADLGVQRISLEGYTASDLSTYYGGTIVLKKLRSGYAPFLIQEVLKDGDVVYGIGYSMHRKPDLNEHLSSPVTKKRASVELSKLFRFSITSTYVLTLRGLPMYLEYRSRKTYKKGIAPSAVSGVDLISRRRTDNTDSAMALVLSYLNPCNHVRLKGSGPLSGFRIVSDNLVAYNNVLYIGYNQLTVGTVSVGDSGSEISTPFPAIKARLLEYLQTIQTKEQEDVLCQTVQTVQTTQTTPAL